MIVHILPNKRLLLLLLLLLCSECFLFRTNLAGGERQGVPHQHESSTAVRAASPSAAAGTTGSETLLPAAAAAGTDKT